MIVDRKSFREHFELMLAEAKKTAMGKTVLLLVAAECDAMCAATSLKRLLDIDRIGYRVAPVSGYTDIKAELATMPSETKTVILVGCGARADLKGDLELDQHRGLRIYVLDSHLPVYHSNINDRGTIFVLQESIEDGFLKTVPDDGDSDIDEAELNDDDEDGADDDSDGGSADDEHDEDGYSEAGSGGSASPGHKRKRSGRGSGSVSDGDDDDHSGSQVEAGDGAGPAEAGSPRSSLSGDSDGHRKRRKRLRTRAEIESDEEGSGSDSDGEDEDDGSGGGDRARRARQQRIDVLVKQDKRRRLERFNRYYESFVCALPASYTAWIVCEEMGRERTDLLWLACVGITDMLLCEKISAESYDFCQGRLAARARSLCGDSPKPTREAVINNHTHVTFATTKKYGHVAPSEEPRWPLHRHWSIRDAMIHSDYVATRLDTFKLGTEAGAAQIDKFLSKTAVWNKQLKGPGDMLDRVSRERLFSKMKELIQDPQYKMGNEMFFPSFIRIVDKEREISAGDMCAAVNGLLSAVGTTPALVELAEKKVAEGRAAAAQGGANGPRGGSPALGPNNAAGGVDGGPVVDVAYFRSWRHNFNLAMDALGHKMPEHFATGVACYKALQETILRVGPRLIRTGRVHNLKFVRWVELDDDLAPSDRAMFAQPAALAALGRFIIRLCRDSLMTWRKKKRRVDDRPVVLTVQHPSTSKAVAALGPQTQGWVTVLGLAVPSREGEVPGHGFHELLNSAAIDSRAAYIQDSFDNASLIMDARSVEGFMRVLDVVPVGQEDVA